jgi:hypothetical protein
MTVARVRPEAPHPPRCTCYGGCKKLSTLFSRLNNTELDEDGKYFVRNRQNPLRHSDPTGGRRPTYGPTALRPITRPFKLFVNLLPITIWSYIFTQRDLNKWQFLPRALPCDQVHTRTRAR